MFRTRLLVGVIGALIVIAIIYAGGVPFWALIFGGVVIGTDEMAKMLLDARHLGKLRLTATILGAAVGAAWSLLPLGHPGLLAAPFGAIVLLCSVYIIGGYGPVGAIDLLARASLTMLFCPLTFPLLVRMRNLDIDATPAVRMLWVVLALGMPWMGDTGAYFAGRAFGKHKLAPSISPKKTWEGVIGGLFAGLGFSFLMIALLWLAEYPIHWGHALLLGPPAVALGVLGDLTESLIKRDAGVKDSGIILPGHGGLLDRIDGLAFSTPYVYAYALWFYPLVSRWLGV